MPSSITLRLPPAIDPSQADFIPPTIDWLSGTWRLTHSTLSMWKSNRNITMNYTIIPASSAQDPSNKLDDVTSYQPLASSKFKSIHGIDTARGTDTSLWDWRGKGWLTIATSHWEVLGYGDIGEEAGGPGQWLVTYFTATRFTNAGISVYSRAKEGNPEALVREILESISGMQNETVKKLTGEMFETVRN